MNLHNFLRQLRAPLILKEVEKKCKAFRKASGNLEKKPIEHLIATFAASQIEMLSLHTQLIADLRVLCENEHDLERMNEEALAHMGEQFRRAFKIGLEEGKHFRVDNRIIVKHILDFLDPKGGNK